MSLSQSRANQRGSALLIVFVFAAMLAIMLYREMPVASFEAQRQKEELLIDRGNEYKRAIKLYVRKFQTFPASMEALENTNRMRFLRNRYVDPFSGKDDWRLLHAGPGGIIIDSKIKQKTGDLNGGPGAPTAGNNGFGNSTAASATSTDASALLNTQPGQSAGALNAFPQRPPAVALNGGGAGNGDMPAMPIPSAGMQPADPQATPPVPSPGLPYPGYPGPPVAAIPGQTDTLANGSQPMPNSAMASEGGTTMPYQRAGRYRNANPTGDSYPQGQQYPTAAGQPSANSQDPQAMMQALLNNANPQPTAQAGGFNNNRAGAAAGSSSTPAFSGAFNQGNNAGGGIAGVASKSKGPTIKTVNDQTDRTLWEFVYDMRQEAMANAPGLGNGNTATGLGNGLNQQSPGVTTNFGGSPTNFGGSPGPTTNFGGSPGSPGGFPSPGNPRSNQ
jgi:type II secretory pathway pseudopilin PulG